MADVRAMLRASRDARQKITHPHASYTSSGKLTCNLCEIVIKHESAWQSHLHTTQHNLRQSRATEAAASRKLESGNRKRKASDPESPRVEDRKRVKPALTADDGRVDRSQPVPDGSTKSDSLPALVHEESPQGAAQSAAVAGRDDTAELDDFERELAELEASVAPRPNAAIDVTISSAPLSAAEVAAQAREEQSAQRGKRDAELAGEKEDAARLLEEEFEQMENLEERVKTLRARREALRAAPTEKIDPGQSSLAREGRADDVDDNSDDSTDDDDYWNV